ncbi:hypothetical protein Hanom_Chr13g01213101 [Helianthus anomalus]
MGHLNSVEVESLLSCPNPCYFLWHSGEGEYGWRWFVLDWRRGFTDYSTVVHSGGWMLRFRASGRDKGLAAVE